MARTESLYPLSGPRSQRVAEDVVTLTTAFGVVEVYSRDPGFVVAVTGRYFVQIIKDCATTTTVSLQRRALADLALRYDKFGYIALIEPEATLLIAPDVREGFNTLVKRYSPRFTGAAIVYEKTGFHATALRSVVTAINFASRASHPNHVFADLREGAIWLGKLTPPEPTPMALVNIVQQLRLTPSTGSR
jgi:hypothetical protein